MVEQNPEFPFPKKISSKFFPSFSWAPFLLGFMDAITLLRHPTHSSKIYPRTAFSWGFPLPPPSKLKNLKVKTPK